ncbi:MAG: hypothetical protein J6386_10390 [Candidatus Synoicihabitans palmerolidicus]|nr:hypothetical protein [Candidatus Synoicihabitans palmerolidicus]
MNCDLREFEIHANTLLILSPGQVHSWNYGDNPEGMIVGFS